MYTCAWTPCPRHTGLNCACDLWVSGTRPGPSNYPGTSLSPPRDANRWVWRCVGLSYRRRPESSGEAMAVCSYAKCLTSGIFSRCVAKHFSNTIAVLTRLNFGGFGTKWTGQKSSSDGRAHVSRMAQRAEVFALHPTTTPISSNCGSRLACRTSEREARLGGFEGKPIHQTGFSQSDMDFIRTAWTWGLCFLRRLSLATVCFDKKAGYWRFLFC